MMRCVHEHARIDVVHLRGAHLEADIGRECKIALQLEKVVNISQHNGVHVEEQHAAVIQQAEDLQLAKGAGMPSRDWCYLPDLDAICL